MSVIDTLLRHAAETRDHRRGMYTTPRLASTIQQLLQKQCLQEESDTTTRIKATRSAPKKVTRGAWAARHMYHAAGNLLPTAHHSISHG
jgi:hypothetical protein